MFWERSVKSWIGRPLSSPSYKFTPSPPSAFPIIFHIGNANLKFNSIKSHYIYFILHSYTRHIINYVSLVVILTQRHAFDLTVDIIVQRSHSQTKTQYFRRYEQSRASVTLVPPCASFQTPKVCKCLRTQTILLYVRGDNRERDGNEHLLPLLEPVKKAAAPSSDISQKDMVSLYFDEVDRSVVSQSKGKNHVFAAPDWKLMEAYLFPFIRVNSENRQFKVGRLHIKHVAFRIWEHLATEGRVTLKYGNDDEEPENVPLGDLRGWWLESDGFLPRGYSQWERCKGDVPGIFLLHFWG
jgi:hypothetical protein